MEEQEMIFYNVTCHTTGCRAEEFTIRSLAILNTLFMCGGCGQMVDDFSICEDQNTKDGCVAFCKNSANHSSWTECFNESIAV